MKDNKSQYELFHQWLNDCPTKIEDYQDNIDSVTIRFDTPFTEETIWTIIQNLSILIYIKRYSKIITFATASLILFLIHSSTDYNLMNNNEIKRLQRQSIDLLELIEDTSEHFCDENRISGEQFYVMMKALVDCKLKEFPLDFEQLEEDIYDD